MKKMDRRESENVRDESREEDEGEKEMDANMGGEQWTRRTLERGVAKGDWEKAPTYVEP